MVGREQHTIGNRLLASLDAHDFEQLAPWLEERELRHGDPIVEAGQSAELIYFPVSSIASIVATSPEGQRVEAGIYGRDGFGPTASVLGVNLVPLTHFFQVPGRGYCLPTTVLTEAANGSTTLKTQLLRYAHVLAVQTSFTALSNAVHQIDERLARWLLMCHDRAETDELNLTHEFLSLMLAVRRASVTTSLHVLEGKQLIRTERGFITVRDRAGLEAFARDAYGPPEAEYERLFGTSH